MERLTERDTNGHWRIKEFSEVLPAYWQACNRLAAYEDTGLEPEDADQIRKAAEYMMFEAVGDFVRLAISNFDDLQAYRTLGTVAELSAQVKARDEGRVVVLRGDHIATDGEEALRMAMYHCGMTNNPVTRYTADAIAEKLIRAEAEATLNGGAYETNPV